LLPRVAMCHILKVQKPNHLTLRIEQQTTDRLQRLSTARNLSVGWLVRQAVKEYLAREERTKT
jgi:predicted transcriptional regulator